MPPLRPAETSPSRFRYRWFWALLVLLLHPPSLRAATTDGLLQAVKDPRYKVRIQAAAALATSGDARSLDALLNLLHDPEALVRAATCDALIALGDPAALDAMQALFNDSDTLVRRRARLGVQTLHGLSRLQQTAKGSVQLDLPVDNSGGDFGDLATVLRRGLEEKLRERSTALSTLRKRYRLLSQIRKVERYPEADGEVIEVHCDLTILELPSQALRLSNQVTASVMSAGLTDQVERRELAEAATEEAGRRLIEDFASWALVQ